MSAYQGGDEFKPIFSRGPVLVLKFLLTAVLSICLMVYDQRTGDGNRVRDALAVATHPLQWLAEVPQGIVDMGVHFSSRESLIAENEDLREKQMYFNSRLQKLASLEEENRRLRALFDSSKQIHDAVMIVEILSASLDPYRQTIRINKGSRDGIIAGQALIDADGVLGQVLETTPYTATAALITDENQGVPVEINRTGLQTVAHGGGENGILRLPYLPSSSDVQVGDLLISSGLGGHYPAGYPVGRVSAKSHQPGDAFLAVEAVPTARLMHRREVMLVMQGKPAADTASLIEPGAQPDQLAEAD